MNKQLVTISAKFADKARYLAHSPDSVEYFYEHDGKPLNATHTKKIHRILDFKQKHNLTPVFVPLDTLTEDSKDFVCEAWVDLSLWSNSGLPRYKIKDIRTGKHFNGLPCCNTGVKASPEPR